MFRFIYSSISIVNVEEYHQWLCIVISYYLLQTHFEVNKFKLYIINTGQYRYLYRFQAVTIIRL